MPLPENPFIAIMAIEDPEERARQLEALNARLQAADEAYIPSAVPGESTSSQLERLSYHAGSVPEKPIQELFEETGIGRRRDPTPVPFGPERGTTSRELIPSPRPIAPGSKLPGRESASVSAGVGGRTRLGRSGPISKKGLLGVAGGLEEQRGKLGRLVEGEPGTLPGTETGIPPVGPEGTIEPIERLTESEEKVAGILDQTAWTDEYNQLLAKPDKTDLDLARMQELTVKMQGATQQMQATKELGEKQRAYDDMQKLEEKQAEERKIRRSDIDMSIRKLEDIEGQMGKEEIDPERLVKEMPTWRFVLGVLAGAVGQMGGLRGGDKKAQNAFGTMLDKAIQRDIQAQRVNLDRLGKRAGVQTNIISKLSAHFEDIDTQDRAAKVLTLEKLGRGLDLMATKYKGTAIENNIRVLQNQIFSQQKAATRNFMLKVDESTRKNLEAQTSAYGVKQRTALGWAQLKEMKARREGASNLRLMSEKTAKELGTWEATGTVVANLGEAHAALKSEGIVPDAISRRVPGWLGATDASNFDKKVKPIIADIIRSFSGAQVTDKEREWFMEMMPLASDTPETGQEKIKAMMDFLQRKQDGIIVGLEKGGFHPGAFQKSPPPIGETKPTY